jgi:hypothetical protein
MTKLKICQTLKWRARASQGYVSSVSDSPLGFLYGVQSSISYYFIDSFNEAKIHMY